MQTQRRLRRGWTRLGGVAAVLALFLMLTFVTQCARPGASRGDVLRYAAGLTFDTLPPNADTAMWVTGSDTSWLRAAPEAQAATWTMDQLRAGRIIGKLTTTGARSPIPSIVGDMFVYVDSLAPGPWRMLFISARNDTTFEFPLIPYVPSPPPPTPAPTSDLDNTGGGSVYVTSCDAHACPPGDTARVRSTRLANIRLPAPLPLR